MRKETKHIIWSSDVGQLEDWQDFLEDYAENNGLDLAAMSDHEKWELVYEMNSDYLGDEKMNLDIPLDGQVIAIAELGFWFGRRQGYKMLGSNINSIFDSFDCDDHEWYADQYNVRCNASHHDGTHHILFREVKPGVNPRVIQNAILNGEEITSAFLGRYTRSLLPYVAGVYGWPCRTKKGVTANV